MGNEVAKAESKQPAENHIQNDAKYMFDALAQAASDPNVSPEKLNAMLDVQQRIVNFRREDAFNEAWALVMQEIAPLKFYKNKKVEYEKEKGKPEKGKTTAFKFCPLSDIDKQTRPILLKHGFYSSYTTEPRPGDGGGIIMTATILHESGHRIKTVLPMPLDATGGKSNAQGMGSSVSYAWRNCLRMMLNIICVDDDEDDDGQGGAPAKISADQVKELERLLTVAKADQAAFLKFMGVAALEDIWTINFQQAVVSLNAKAAKK